ncbi:MAG: hypothetical protein UT91_C0011G0029 [Parcubacteria group bacterium GW2011_GWA2_40_23]|nr:MAG: hypothetical protein UT91_C0011G0029 [Parcubacteria group bacterium GW2011_GWA2_40_23]
MHGQLVYRVKVGNFLKLFVAFCLFANKLRNEEHLLPKSPFDLMVQFFLGLSVVKIVGWKIVGHVTLWDLETGWYELGTLWVDPAMRKHGVGEEIMSNLLRQRDDLRILMTTTNPIVKAMSAQLGLQKISFHDLEPKVQASTCVCSSAKMGTNDFRCCCQKDFLFKFSIKTCFVFVNKRLAKLLLLCYNSDTCQRSSVGRAVVL